MRMPRSIPALTVAVNGNRWRCTSLRSATLEHGITDPTLTQLTRRALVGKPDWPWLTPPERYEITVHDLAQPMTVEDVRRWASSVWEAWAPRHRTVRGWAEPLLAAL
jgi:hypothetical protein